VTTAPWWVVALVSSLPVLVLGAASLLWHLAAIDPAVAASLAAEPVSGRSFAIPAAAGDLVPAAALGPDTPAGSASGPNTSGPDRAILADASTPGRDASPLARPLARPSALDTAATAPSDASTAGAAARPLARPAAATSPRTGAVREPIPANDDYAAAEPVATATTATGAATDAQILAVITGEPPSIRSLMRSHSIGQTRATRIHRAASRTHQHDPTDTRTSTQELPEEAEAGIAANSQSDDDSQNTDQNKDQNANQGKIHKNQEPLMITETAGDEEQESHPCITDRVGQTKITEETGSAIHASATPVVVQLGTTGGA
jgi:hypothetical protein